MKIQEYSTVRLKDGREGMVIHVVMDGEAYCVEFELPNGRWDFNLFLPEEIECVIEDPPPSTTPD